MNKFNLPTRSATYGIGKEIGGSVYLHRHYERLLGLVAQQARKSIPSAFEYTVVKYNRRTGGVSFVASPDFDSRHEPMVGEIWTIHADQSAKYWPVRTDPYIYHHKWLMVDDDYLGFDVEDSKARSRAWLSLSGIDKSRIGTDAYWQRHVVPLLSENALYQKHSD